MTKQPFQTEVSQLLNLIIHSLYSHKEIFLRELVSNASDALDKMKYLSLTDEAFKEKKFVPRIDISYTEGDHPTLTVADNGIGMNDRELVENLGTIARSGTRRFLEQMTGDAKKDSNLIGQFGVGFYASFMVAETVEVTTRRAGEEQAWLWKSDGTTGFEIEKSVRKDHGTTVVLKLNEEGKEFASRWKIDEIVKKYSNHISFPIFLTYLDKDYDKEGNVKSTREKVDQINAATAFWKRPKSELKQKDYHEFYRSIAMDYDDPLLYIHTQAEGTIDYTTLFYIPKKAPVDLYYADYKPGVKLYVKRVFITDDDKELLPTYLRFIRGIIDSEDLPLNVSREILQQNRILAKIKNNSVKKILSELAKLARDEKKYLEFYREFGRPLKEGVFQDLDRREELMELLRFKSTKVDGYTSLKEYVERMDSSQKAIYYLTGETEDAVRNSPLLEIYREKDVEVLLMDDEIDELVFPAIPKYKDYDLKPINRSDAGEELKSDEEKKPDLKEYTPLLKKLKKVLGDDVKDVRLSKRLSDSPSCIVADSDDPTVQMQGILRAMGQTVMNEAKPILEINPDHEIVLKLKTMRKSKAFDDAARLLLDQALMLEGVKLENPAEFVKRMNAFLSKAL
ncbi:MAG: molecular chaperone HtpG [Candidatus Neomarinimicrobiota bacterium]|nr:MAG: molecular chaperone HtpG [Candidatus Neomarinimicrobiota bacterium]